MKKKWGNIISSLLVAGIGTGFITAILEVLYAIYTYFPISSRIIAFSLIFFQIFFLSIVIMNAPEEN